MSGFNSCDLCMHCLGQKNNVWQKTQLQLIDKDESADVFFAPHDYVDKGLIDRLFARALNAGVQAWRIVGGELNDFVSVLNCITFG